MAHVVKSGYVKRHSKSLLSGGWQKCWLVLLQDSNLIIYKKSGDTNPKGNVLLKDVCKRFAYGQYTAGMSDRPNLPGGASIEQILAIPARNNSNAKIHWFLCDSEKDLHDWMTAICNTLPQPGSAGHTTSHAQPIQPTQAPPPAYSAAPGIGFAGMAGPPPVAYPQPQAAPTAYPQQAYPSQPAYPQQPYYPNPPQAYPQQPYVQQGYPQQAYPQQQGYAVAPPGYAPPGQYAQYPQTHGYYQQPHQNVVYTQQKKSGGGMLGGNAGKMAAGLIGGAALGYGASRMLGGGFGGGFGGFGHGCHGSWSSLSSFGSCGSFGSFD